VYRRGSIDYPERIAPCPLYLLKRNCCSGEVVVDGFLIERIAEFDDDIIHSAGNFRAADKLSQPFIFLLASVRLTEQNEVVSVERPRNRSGRFLRLGLAALAAAPARNRGDQNAVDRFQITPRGAALNRCRISIDLPS
jgi:hypothetical protein